MNRILVFLCVGFLLFSCKSKKAIVTKKGNYTERQVVIDKTDNQTEVIEEAPKVYASNTERYIHNYKEVAQNEMVLPSQRCVSLKFLLVLPSLRVF